MVQIRSVGVIGAGQMGTGIAHVVALGGYDVLLHDVSQARIDAGIELIHHNMTRQVHRGIIDQDRFACVRPEPVVADPGRGAGQRRHGRVHRSDRQRGRQPGVPTAAARFGRAAHVVRRRDQLDQTLHRNAGPRFRALPAHPREVGTRCRRAGFLGRRGQLERVHPQVENRGRGRPGDLGGKGHQVDRAAVGEGGQPLVEQPGPDRAQPLDAGRAEPLGDVPPGAPVIVALLVEEPAREER